MDDFELGKQGWFEVQNVEKNDFLNQKLTTDQYGIWYSVKFTGDASTHLWQTKTPPVEGEKYWGSIELTKSGKTTKFHWDKQNAPSENRPENAHESKGYQKSPEQEESIARAVALKAAVDNTVDDYDPLEVLEIADVFLVWLRGEKPSTDSEKSSKSKVDEVFGLDGEPLPEYPGDELD